MSQEEILEKSKKVCKDVACRLKDTEETPSPLEVKMMIEDELDYGLSEDEIITLAITFKHIDNLFDDFTGNTESTQIMFR